MSRYLGIILGRQKNSQVVFKGMFLGYVTKWQSYECVAAAKKFENCLSKFCVIIRKARVSKLFFPFLFFEKGRRRFRFQQFARQSRRTVGSNNAFKQGFDGKSSFFFANLSFIYYTFNFSTSISTSNLIEFCEVNSLFPRTGQPSHEILYYKH